MRVARYAGGRRLGTYDRPTAWQRAERVRCPSDKLIFDTRAIAQTHAARASKRLGKPMYVYKCPACRFWHFTHHATWLNGKPSRNGGKGC